MAYESESYFDDFQEAYAHAINRANRYRQAYGIEKGTPPLQKKFRIAMIPNDPSKRFGWEYRCQAVEPGTPLSDRQVALLAAKGIAVFTSAGQVLQPAASMGASCLDGLKSRSFPAGGDAPC
jgi:hypothetical protein